MTVGLFSISQSPSAKPFLLFVFPNFSLHSSYGNKSLAPRKALLCQNIQYLINKFTKPDVPPVTMNSLMCHIWLYQYSNKTNIICITPQKQVSIHPKLYIYFHALLTFHVSQKRKLGTCLMGTSPLLQETHQSIK